MLRNRFFINLVLLVIILLLGGKLYSTVSRTADIPIRPAEKKDEEVKVDIKPVDRTINDSNVHLIAKLDLFRPSRTPFVGEKKDETVKETAPGNPPKLNGTVLLNNRQTAILQDPNTKKTAMYHVNDTVAGFTVSEIMEEKVVLLRGAEKVEIKLREDKGVAAPKRVAPRRVDRGSGAQPQTKVQKTDDQSKPTPRERRRRPVRRRSAPPR
ncbi:MAG: hypothetical protein JSV11_01610 [Nitrospiraceae bacterium]|nr:MAG: hypothetical protein JSV11_01610 [Nitrospiraceae bacterium]